MLHMLVVLLLVDLLLYWVVLLFVGTDLYVNTVKITLFLGDIGSKVSFTAGNNIYSPENITGVVFDNAITRAFCCIISVKIVKSVGSNLYAKFELFLKNKKNDLKLFFI